MDVHEAKKKLYNFKATVKGYPEIKTRVKVATNLDPWGPTTDQMKEICDACQNYEDKRLITKALWKRITTSANKDWPHVYKALAIFEYLLLHGPESIAVDVQQQVYNLKTLHDFQSVDEKGKDNGLAIREKSKKIVEWVSNTEVLQEERSKANALQDRLRGIASGGSAGGGARRVDSDDEGTGHFHDRRRSVSPTPAAHHAEAAGSTANARAALFEDAMPLDQLANDQAYVAEQQQIMESFKPSQPAPAVAHAPAPAVVTPPAQPKPAPKPAAPSVEIDDFFGPSSTVSAKPPSLEDDIFGPSPLSQPAAPAPAPAAAPAAAVKAPVHTPPAAAAPKADDGNLFGDPFWGNSGAAAPASRAPATTFDATFDALCNLDNISGKRAAPPPPTAAAPGGAPVALNELRKQKEFEAQMQTSLGANADPFNPFA